MRAREAKKKVNWYCPSCGKWRRIELVTAQAYHTKGIAGRCKKCKIAAQKGDHPEHAVRCARVAQTPRPADIPTTHAPGTPGKLAVMRWRDDHGQQVFHPLDARYDCDPRPYEYLRRLRAMT